MKFKIFIGLVIVGMIGLIIFSPGSNDAKSTGAAQVAKFSTVQTDITHGGQLLDVRTADEYEVGHIDGAINLSLQDIQKSTLPTVAKDKPVYVYCHSGNRASQAAVLLKQAGYQHVVDLGAITHVQSIGGIIKT
jgi:phage shock protein E